MITDYLKAQTILRRIPKSKECKDVIEFRGLLFNDSSDLVCQVGAYLPEVYKNPELEFGVIYRGWKADGNAYHLRQGYISYEQVMDENMSPREIESRIALSAMIDMGDFTEVANWLKHSKLVLEKRVIRQKRFPVLIEKLKCKGIQPFQNVLF